MKTSQFSLIPFDKVTDPQIEVAGILERNREQLNIKYQLTGKLSEILFASPSPAPRRKYNLWEATCLEFFLRPFNTTQYWEFNLAPSGDWNVFRFIDYRQDITEELAYDCLRFEVFRRNNLLNLNLELDLSLIVHPKTGLDIAISAVIQNTQQKLSYWALIHPTTTADFHHQKSFVIKI